MAAIQERTTVNPLPIEPPPSMKEQISSTNPYTEIAQGVVDTIEDKGWREVPVGFHENPNDENKFYDFKPGEYHSRLQTRDGDTFLTFIFEIDDMSAVICDSQRKRIFNLNYEKGGTYFDEEINGDGSTNIHLKGVSAMRKGLSLLAEAKEKLPYSEQYI
jgi:hypothetical protein